MAIVEPENPFVRLPRFIPLPLNQAVLRNPAPMAAWSARLIDPGPAATVQFGQNNREQGRGEGFDDDAGIDRAAEFLSRIHVLQREGNLAGAADDEFDQAGIGLTAPISAAHADGPAGGGMNRSRLGRDGLIVA